MPFLGIPVQEAPHAIIFDIGRVLIRVDMSRAFEAIGKNNGMSHLQVLQELEADPRWRDWQEGRMTPRDWHAHLDKKFKLSHSFDEFCAIWNSILDPEPMLPEGLFERLATKCRLALLSNTDPIHVAHIEATYPFVRHFPLRIYSCHIRLSKPSPMIYHHTLRKLDAMPEEAMFIDDMRENVAAAVYLGITAFHFTSAQELLYEFSRLGLWNF